MEKPLNTNADCAMEEKWKKKSLTIVRKGDIRRAKKRNGKAAAAKHKCYLCNEGKNEKLKK